MEFNRFEEEKKSCSTKELQIKFMYKYYASNAITINQLAVDYQDWEMSIRFNSN